MTAARFLITAIVASTATAVSLAQPAEYRDPANRFLFSYPASFGAPSVGTDNGFGDRVAAVRFAVFSAGGIGGEAVLGKGRPSLDVQAAGGLYDDIVTGTLPAPVLRALRTALPALTRENFCGQIGLEHHVDVNAGTFAALPAPQRAALASMDAMGNVAPRVSRCDAAGDVVVFDKEAAMTAGGPRRRVYGAVRFLAAPYTTFQLIRAGGSADPSLIDSMRDVVASWRPR
jgi:hypothetical protein